MDKVWIAVVLSAMIFGFTSAGYTDEILTEPVIDYQLSVLSASSNQLHLPKDPDVGEPEANVLPPMGFLPLAQIMMGSCGAIVGVLPGAIYRWYGESTRRKFIYGNAAMAIGTTFVTAGVVHYLGKVVLPTAPFSRTVVGATWVSVPILALVLTDIMGDGLGAYLLVSGVPMGATFGWLRSYNLPAESGGAAVNIRDSQIRFGIPRPYHRFDGYSRANHSQNIDLLRVRF